MRFIKALLNPPKWFAARIYLEECQPTRLEELSNLLEWFRLEFGNRPKTGTNWHLTNVQGGYKEISKDGVPKLPQPKVLKTHPLVALVSAGSEDRPVYFNNKFETVRLSFAPYTSCDAVLGYVEEGEHLDRLTKLVHHLAEISPVLYAFGIALTRRDLNVWLHIDPVEASSPRIGEPHWSEFVGTLRGEDWNKLRHHMRGPHQWQILTTQHLSRKVGSQSLGEWIESSVDHGKLTLFAESLYEWILSPTQLSIVSAKLRFGPDSW